MHNIFAEVCRNLLLLLLLLLYKISVYYFRSYSINMTIVYSIKLVLSLSFLLLLKSQRIWFPANGLLPIGKLRGGSGKYITIMIRLCSVRFMLQHISFASFHSQLQRNRVFELEWCVISALSSQYTCTWHIRSGRSFKSLGINYYLSSDDFL